jgi:hypothetical protein
VTASIVAYVVQATFNVQQIGLTFVFWLSVGCLAALARAAGVPDTLRPRVLVATTAGAEPSQAGRGPGPRATAAPSYWSKRRRGKDYTQEWPTAVSVIGVAVVVALLSVGADMPYRADHDYWAANISIRPNPKSSAPTLIGQQFFNDMHKALSLNPWEPTYPAYEATIYNNVSAHVSNASQAISDLSTARDLLKKSVAEEPLWGPYPASEAQVDLELAQLQPAQAKADLAAAASLDRAAIRDSPRDSSYRTLLSKILTTHPAPAPPKAKSS